MSKIIPRAACYTPIWSIDVASFCCVSINYTFPPPMRGIKMDLMHDSTGFLGTKIDGVTEWREHVIFSLSAVHMPHICIYQ